MTMRRLIVHNFWLKIVSVALATVVWMAIHYGIQNDLGPSQTIINRLVAPVYIRVRVEVIKAAEDKRAFKITPNEVLVVAHGEVADLRQGLRLLRAYVDVSDFRAGQTVSKAVHIDSPPGVRIKDVEPGTVAVEQVTE